MKTVKDIFDSQIKTVNTTDIVRKIEFLLDRAEGCDTDLEALDELRRGLILMCDDLET